MSALVKILKTAKRVILGDKSRIPGADFLSLTRRIERVNTKERICAMTFDDGPCAMPPVPWGDAGATLTGVLLDTLARHGAHGTFDVVGDTSENYPDEIGKSGTASWGGVAYDHYPHFKKDSLGGAANQPQLIRRILEEGHEISSHTYRHVLFGAKNVVYQKRHHLENLTQVVEDLDRLDALLKDEFGYRIKLSRPPHYVDKIGGGFTSYDAYDLMGYQYMAASFDGAGWLPKSSYEEEVGETWRPMEEKLKADPDFFCGQIIFQKDGYNMASRSPIAHGLDKQLELLTGAGYRVVTVSELLAECPFLDTEPGTQGFDAAVKLLDHGRCVCYRDNTLRPHLPVTRGEMAMLLAPREAILKRLVKLRAGHGDTAEYADMKVSHPYSSAARWACEEGYLSAPGGVFSPAHPLRAEELAQIAHKLNVKAAVSSGPIPRYRALEILAEALD